MDWQQIAVEVAFSAAINGVIVGILVKLYLEKQIEKYRSDLQRGVEDHKSDLQRERILYEKKLATFEKLDWLVTSVLQPLPASTGSSPLVENELATGAVIEAHRLLKGFLESHGVYLPRPAFRLLSKMYLALHEEILIIPPSSYSLPYSLITDHKDNLRDARKMMEEKLGLNEEDPSTEDQGPPS